MTSQKIYYWDACAWIGMLNEEREKYPALLSIWKHAESDKCKILTSTISRVEVIKKKFDDQDATSLSSHENSEITRMFQQEHVILANVDFIIADKAAELRAQYRELRKTPDAIHLATASYWNCGVMHTYDKSDLLSLNGKIHRRDGILLDIETPEATVLGPLFRQVTVEDEEQV